MNAWMGWFWVKKDWFHIVNRFDLTGKIWCSVAVKEIFEDQGILNVYGLTDKKFLKILETLGLDW